jgi:hypothetical protein
MFERLLLLTLLLPACVNPARGTACGELGMDCCEGGMPCGNDLQCTTTDLACTTPPSSTSSYVPANGVCGLEGNVCCNPDTSQGVLCSPSLVCYGRTMRCVDAKKLEAAKKLIDPAAQAKVCGAAFEPCCSDPGTPTCRNNASCVSFTCAPQGDLATISCGVKDKPCCGNQQCIDPFHCTNNVCATAPTGITGATGSTAGAFMPACTGAVYNRHCYEGFSTALSWTAARAACIKLGGTLATIGDAAENDFVNKQFTSNTDTWIGLNDLAVTGTYVWVNGEPVNYFNWEVGEPNHVGGVEHTIWMRGDGRWNDGNAVTLEAYVCERGPGHAPDTGLPAPSGTTGQTGTTGTTGPSGTVRTSTFSGPSGVSGAASPPTNSYLADTEPAPVLSLYPPEIQNEMGNLACGSGMWLSLAASFPTSGSQPTIPWALGSRTVTISPTQTLASAFAPLTQVSNTAGFIRWNAALSVSSAIVAGKNVSGVPGAVGGNANTAAQGQVFIASGGNTQNGTTTTQVRTVIRHVFDTPGNFMIVLIASGLSTAPTVTMVEAIRQDTVVSRLLINGVGRTNIAADAFLMNNVMVQDTLDVEVATADGSLNAYTGVSIFMCAN